MHSFVSALFYSRSLRFIYIVCIGSLFLPIAELYFIIQLELYFII